jgi:hypothetical protein
MSHAIIRGATGRRHEVNFGDGPVRVEIHPSEETVEIYVEADFETLPEGRRRFVLQADPRPRGNLDSRGLRLGHWSRR